MKNQNLDEKNDLLIVNVGKNLIAAANSFYAFIICTLLYIVTSIVIFVVNKDFIDVEYLQKIARIQFIISGIFVFALLLCFLSFAGNLLQAGRDVNKAFQMLSKSNSDNNAEPTE